MEIVSDQPGIPLSDEATRHCPHKGDEAKPLLDMYDDSAVAPTYVAPTQDKEAKPAMDMYDGSAVAPTSDEAPTQGNEELELESKLDSNDGRDDEELVEAEVESIHKEKNDKSYDRATVAPSMFDKVLAPNRLEELCGPTTSMEVCLKAIRG